MVRVRVRVRVMVRVRDKARVRGSCVVLPQQGRGAHSQHVAEHKVPVDPPG